MPGIFYHIMLEKTEAIVIGLKRNKDNSSLLSLYTRAGGRTYYIVYGNRLRSILNPLSLIEITALHKPGYEWHTLQSARLTYVPTQLPTHVVKQCVALFIAEALDKTLRHPMPDELMFDYLTELVRELDQTEQPEQIPGQFLQTINRLLGYGDEQIEELKNLKSAEIIRLLL